MKIVLVRSFLFFAMIALLIAASSINTNYNSVDEPGATYQEDGQTAGRLTVNECYKNTAHPKKSSIEAGYKDPQTEKPLLRAYNSYIAGGKGIGITQSNDLSNG
ncbi:MAG: hypothetical protein IPH11_11125 [Ignavibacteriales bacterium]|nr:hypothetical protein [Ignavibacteriales bacterium]